MSKTSILVVDDDKALAEGTADVLDAKGYQVSAVNDDFAALELVKKTPFDIVLMDIRVPGMNRVETYRRMKEVRPTIKAILMTAYSDKLCGRLFDGLFNLPGLDFSFTFQAFKEI